MEELCLGDVRGVLGGRERQDGRGVEDCRGGEVDGGEDAAAWREGRFVVSWCRCLNRKYVCLFACTWRTLLEPDFPVRMGVDDDRIAGVVDVDERMFYLLLLYI